MTMGMRTDCAACKVKITAMAAITMRAIVPGLRRGPATVGGGSPGAPGVGGNGSAAAARVLVGSAWSVIV